MWVGGCVFSIEILDRDAYESISRVIRENKIVCFGSLCERVCLCVCRHSRCGGVVVWLDFRNVDFVSLCQVIVRVASPRLTNLVSNVLTVCCVWFGFTRR